MVSISLMKILEWTTMLSLHFCVTLLVLIVRLVCDLLANDRVELIYVCSLQHNVNQSEINKCNGGGDEENEIQDPSIYYRVTMKSAWGFSQNFAKKKTLWRIVISFTSLWTRMHVGLENLTSLDLQNKHVIYNNV